MYERTGMDGEDLMYLDFVKITTLPAELEVIVDYRSMIDK